MQANMRKYFVKYIIFGMTGVSLFDFWPRLRYFVHGSEISFVLSAIRMSKMKILLVAANQTDRFMDRMVAASD